MNRIRNRTTTLLLALAPVATFAALYSRQHGLPEACDADLPPKLRPIVPDERRQSA